MVFILRYYQPTEEQKRDILAGEDGCRERLVRYKKAVEQRSGGDTDVYIMTGILAKGGKGRSIHIALGYNTFVKTPMAIPTGYRKVTRGDYVIPDSFREKLCRPARPMPVFKGCLELNAWMEQAAAKGGAGGALLTIADVIAMKPGEKLDVVILDRNIDEWLGQNVEANKPYSARQFFKVCKGVYVHAGGLKGALTWYAETETPILDDPFTFEVLTPTGVWYPLDETGRLPEKDPQGAFKLTMDDKPVHWSKMPTKTPVGCRGPIMKWEALKGMPRVFLYER
jgi:hypothetical protein